MDLFTLKHPWCPAQAFTSQLCALEVSPRPAELQCASSVAKPADGAPAHGELLQSRLASRASLGSSAGVIQGCFPTPSLLESFCFIEPAFWFCLLAVSQQVTQHFLEAFLALLSLVPHLVPWGGGILDLCSASPHL